jgi:predicted nicotinamide N-methyase
MLRQSDLRNYLGTQSNDNALIQEPLTYFDRMWRALKSTAVYISSHPRIMQVYT